MKNVSMKVENDQLVIRVDMKANHGQSKSGKTRIIATTSGNVPVPGTPAKIGLNIYTPIGI